MMSLHSSTHSSQMKTVGPAISLRTSCCDFPQNEQYNVLLLSPPPERLVIPSLYSAANARPLKGHPSPLYDTITSAGAYRCPPLDRSFDLNNMDWGQRPSKGGVDEVGAGCPKIAPKGIPNIFGNVDKTLPNPSL